MSNNHAEEQTNGMCIVWRLNGGQKASNDHAESLADGIVDDVAVQLVLQKGWMVDVIMWIREESSVDGIVVLAQRRNRP